MNQPEDSAKNSIVDFVDDEAFFAINKYKSEIEKVTWVMYLFATFTLFLYVLFIIMNRNYFDWLNVIISVVIIAIYFCLAWYSQHKPFTAFIGMLAMIVIILGTDIIFSANQSAIGLIAKISLIIYICMRLDAAKKVQDYESKQLKEEQLH
jgi:hypothetical protein